MEKFLSLAILLLLAACAVPTPAALTQLSPTEIHTSEASPTSLSPTSIPTETPEPTQTPTETPPPSPTPTFENPTPAPRVAYDEIKALTLFDQTTGWAQWLRHKPSKMWEGYDVERKILRAAGGLERWQDVTPELDDNTLSMASFLDANTALVVFYRVFLPESSETEIVTARTVDGGQTWQTGVAMHFDCCLRLPSQIEMLDANRGWMMAVDDGAMGQVPLAFFRTTDGGLHWEKVYDSNELFQTDPVNTMFAYVNLVASGGFFPLDLDTALFATGSLHRTEDGGKTWQQVTRPIPSPETVGQSEAGMGQSFPAVSGPQFWSEQEGVMVGRYTAEFFMSPDMPTKLPVGEFLYFTTDGGKTWAYKPSPGKIGSVFFLNTQTGWYLGMSDPNPAAPTQLYQTTNGGETWEQIAENSPLQLGSELRFFDAQTGYATTISRTSYDVAFDARLHFPLPYLFFTKDGGRTWEQITPDIVP